MKDISWLLEIPIAHRGFHSPGVPENSIAAFEEAIKFGLNIELDIYKTKDDVLVVFHDENLLRLTSHDKLIEDCTFSELQGLVLDSTNEKISTLDLVLQNIQGKVGILIEIKTHRDIGTVEELLSQLLDNYNGKFAIQSFNPKIVQWFYKNRPSYLRGQLSGSFEGEAISFINKFLQKNLIFNLMSKPDFIAYEYAYLNRWIQILAAISRIPIIVWTIRDFDTAIRVRKKSRNIIFEGFCYIDTTKKST